MKALRVVGGQLSVDDVVIPDSDADALIRVARSGICTPAKK
jgi:threonine dehydrogenase-like Zn-dependent dehydrogenase